MEKKFKETHEDNSKIVITQEDIKKASKNPFRSDVLKSTFGIIVGTVGLGLVARYTNLDDLSYFKVISFVIEGNLAMNLVKNLKDYFGYKRYRKNTDHDVSKDFYINESAMIQKMYDESYTKKR